ncbi:MAG TPA: hypothetical protein PLV03_05200 [Clostridiales bacterium]|nr:hypothetical protein [Clostridiales bacterium]
MCRIQPIAPVHNVVYEVPYPNDMMAGSPGICALNNGRLVVTNDISGEGVKQIPGIKTNIRYGAPVYGKVHVSDDRSDTWRWVTDFPFMHARPFTAGKSLYVLGQAMDLMIIRSDDGGETWTDVCRLTEGEDWHQAPCNYLYANGCIYIVMEHRPPHDCKAWGVSVIAPVLMRGRLDADLTKRENWTFASEMVFRDTVDLSQTDYFGIPFYTVPRSEDADIGGGRRCAPFGWLETNVVQITDPDHIWYDPDGHTFHMLSRAHTGRTNYGCLLKAVENPDGSITTMLETAPSGRHWVYLPIPGGQMKFHILHDDVSGYYWLLSTQSTDSMVIPEKMPKDRYGLPDNERRRLQLHFSKNCVDWCFAGLVDMGDIEKASRHYASMCIMDKDLFIVSRSGDERAQSPHNGNLITLHVVKDFRNLIY